MTKYVPPAGSMNDMATDTRLLHYGLMESKALVLCPHCGRIGFTGYFEKAVMNCLECNTEYDLIDGLTRIPPPMFPELRLFEREESAEKD